MSEEPEVVQMDQIQADPIGYIRYLDTKINYLENTVQNLIGAFYRMQCTGETNTALFGAIITDVGAPTNDQ